jgi:hypothetical protein
MTSLLITSILPIVHDVRLGFEIAPRLTGHGGIVRGLPTSLSRKALETLFAKTPGRAETGGRRGLSRPHVWAWAAQELDGAPPSLGLSAEFRAARSS